MGFDLIAALPQLMPRAIAWAEAQSRKAAEKGEALSEEGMAIAREVGVQHPELVRVVLVEELPFPEDPFLKEAAIQTGLLGPHMAGLTLGHSILVVQGTLDRRLLSHECRHVHQYEEHGSIGAFLRVYLQQIATVGYINAPLEQDARAYER
jgi:hypothetical protein